MRFPRKVPDGARLEAAGGRVSGLTRGVAIYDVSLVLPRHKSKKWRARRPGTTIQRCFVHHSGADGREGFAGFAGSARYSATKTKRKTAWAGTPYTFWFADLPDLDPTGRLVIYRGNPDELRTYHTGGRANTHGVACCFQGNRSKKPPSDEQLEMWAAFVPYALERYQLDDVDDPFCPHSGSRKYGGTGKKSCPGPFIERLVADVVDPS